MLRPHFYRADRHSRLFEKGDLKYVILEQLKDNPTHGYEIIRALEGKFHGFYTPSAGSVYPTLQMLEDMGHVISQESDGKKTYEVTEQGKAFLEEHEDAVKRIKENMKSWMDPSNHAGFHDAMREFGRVVHIVGRRMHDLTPEQMSKIKDIMAKACREIEEIVNS